jgi:tetratricopeptide (TPR) repeat protein
MLRMMILLLFAFSAGASEWLSGTWTRAERKVDAAIGKARAGGDRTTEARLLAKRAHLLLDRSSYHHLGVDEALRAVEQARAAAEASGDRVALGDAVHALARWHYSRKLAGTGEWATVEAALSEAFRIREESGDAAGLSDSWFYRGLVRQMQEDYAPAREAFERSLQLAKDPLARSFAHRHLGYVLQLSGDVESARHHYTRSLELRREAGAHALVPFALNLLADFELETTKDRARAKALLRESVETARCAKSWRGVNAAEGMLAQMFADEGDVRSARKHARRALQAAETYGEAEMIAEARRKAQDW